MHLVSREKSLDLTTHVCVVAIINATPDSYMPLTRSLDTETLVTLALAAAKNGADIIELGAESTGPDTRDVTAEEELFRLLPALRAIRTALPDMWISVDTYKAEIAKVVLDAGADMINDISAGRADAQMLSVIAAAGCPYVIMYAKDPTPRTTKADAQYKDVVFTVHDFLAERIALARAAGIMASQIIVDPGLGHFISSDPKYSFEILNRLREFTDLGPVFVSPSRKSFLAGPNNLPVSERLPSTLEATKTAVKNGALFIRTHDVEETRLVVDAQSL